MLQYELGLGNRPISRALVGWFPPSKQAWSSVSGCLKLARTNQSNYHQGFSKVCGWKKSLSGSVLRNLDCVLLWGSKFHIPVNILGAYFCLPFFSCSSLNTDLQFIWYFSSPCPGELFYFKTSRVIFGHCFWLNSLSQPYLKHHGDFISLGYLWEHN